MTLRKLTLTHNKKKGTWDLKQDKGNQVLHSFRTKANATKGGALKKVLGKKGGSVKIAKITGGYQEERTYPGSKDPRSSKG